MVEWSLFTVVFAILFTNDSRVLHAVIKQYGADGVYMPVTVLMMMWIRSHT